MGLTESKVVVTKEQVEAFLNRLPGALTTAAGTVPLEEKGNYRVAMNAVCSPDTLPKFRADFRIYLEACHYCSQRRESVGVVFLITEDYKFFRTFIRSPTVEQVLGETAKFVLNGDKAVAVKLAGEVIPSL